MSGNNMFKNFTNLDTTYSPNPFQPSYPFSPNSNCAKVAKPNMPYEKVSANGQEVKGYFWYYGNSVNLVFDVSGEIVCADTNEKNENIYFDVKDFILTNMFTFTATIYDFRHLPILTFSNDLIISSNPITIQYDDVKEKIFISLDITNELSSQLVKGTYCLDLIATSKNGYCATLFSSEMNDLTFEVR